MEAKKKLNHSHNIYFCIIRDIRGTVKTTRALFTMPTLIIIYLQMSNVHKYYPALRRFSSYNASYITYTWNFAANHFYFKLLQRINFHHKLLPSRRFASSLQFKR